MKRYYLTTYIAKNGNYLGSHIWAENNEEAKKILKIRNLPQERLDGFYQVNKDEEINHIEALEKPHWIAWIGYLSIRAGKDVDDILGDFGIVHDLIHTRLDDPKYNEYKKELVGKYESLLKELGVIP